MNISPRPYNVGQGYRAEEGAEEQTQDALSQDGRQGGRQQGRQQQDGSRTIARGRAPQGNAQSPIQPAGRPLTAHKGKPVSLGGVKPPKPAPRTMGNQSVPQAAPRMPQKPIQPSPMAQLPQRQPIPSYQPVQKQMAQGAVAQQAPQVDADTQAQVEKMAKNNRVNIAQIIKDFRGTYNAIGTPQCLVDEVEDYLKQVIEHTKGDAPSINFVQTNLQNAAVIIDTYISKTLDKESKVVQNWLDALFLQRINYKYNDGEINQDFLVKFPEGDNAPQQPDSVMDDTPQPPVKQHEPIQEAKPHYGEIPDYEPIPEYQEPVNQTVPIQRAQPPVVQQRPQPVQEVEVEEEPQPERVIRKRNIRPVRVQPQVRPVAPVQRRKPQITIIPEDNELKALFIQAKKQAYSNNPAKAMNIFQKALIRAEAIRDSEAQSKICFEMAKIYDDNNYLVQALNNYNKSLHDTTDTSIKTKAHYSMAKIYDDVNQVHSAINHYMTSVSYAGREDDLSSQSKSLTNIANIYTDRYNQDAFIFYDEANILIEQTDDSETKGYVSSNTAGAYNKFNKPDKALKCYANAVKNYSEAREENSVAENYRAAGELMYDLKNPAKAKILLRKALAHTDAYRDADLINKINDLLEEIG
ncbi:MAG: hypothetical protein K6E29_02220 [Cyanobacteria bacterium RUI128]|nr:hypothetical protein [Cyanobacteria bacterium RUI128]